MRLVIGRRIKIPLKSGYTIEAWTGHQVYPEEFRIELSAPNAHQEHFDSIQTVMTPDEAALLSNFISGSLIEL